jgi:signal transduction histidine kinase
MRPFYEPQADWPTLKERIVESLTARDGTRARIARSDARVLDYAVVPLPDGATQLSFVDVTDRLRVEQALRERAEALEAADRLKSEFISTVSYELRTPLNTIIGFTELLAKQYFGTLNARQSEYCADILTASERLLAIVNDILDLASIDAGRMTLELDAVDPASLLADTAQIMGDLAREREIAVVVEACADAPLRGDERRLKQAMCNLVSNALKFTPPGGRVELSAVREGDSVLLRVADNGIGIAKADLARVFKEFERGNDAETRRMGAGLGLSLVKRIVELHGGSIDLKSEPGVGTVVTCRLARWTEPASG